MNNLAEFLAGTNPTNSASALRLTTVVTNGTNLTVSFPTVKNVPYRILYKDDLQTGAWNILEDQVTGTGSNVPTMDPGAFLLPKRFYRVQVFP